VSFYQRTVFNVKDPEKRQNAISVNQFSVGASHRQNSFLKYGGSVSIIQSASLQRVNAELNSEWKLGKYLSVEGNYKEEVQTFNADLIEKNLKQKNINVNINLFLPSNIGLYSQMIQTRMSDKNVRNLIFASLYYLALQSPIIKTGVNYGGFGFENQVPQFYFSPDKFRNYELFVASENLNNPKAKLLYQALVAGGFQKISSENAQKIYRFDLRTGYNIGSSINLMIYFLRSNSAASSVQGFTYNEWGLNARWTIKKHTF
jgi:hypothetical protein